MIVPLDIVLFSVLLVTAVLALYVHDLLTAVALLSAYSLFTSLLFAGLLSVDVALVEAALNAGLTGLLLVVTILATTRHTAERPPGRSSFVVGAVLTAFLAVMLYASSGLPDRGETGAPAHEGVSETYLASALEDTETPNVVTALLADYRSADTLGETMVILTAALSASLVLARGLRDEEPGGGGPGAEATDGDAGSHDPRDDS